MNEGPPARRKAPRFQRAERVFVRILASDRNRDLAGTIARCTTADLSVGGLRLTVDYPVEPGDILDLWTKLPEHPGTFLLVGEVRWRAAGELEDEQVLGIELVADDPAGENDHGAWRRHVETLAQGD